MASTLGSERCLSSVLEKQLNRLAIIYNISSKYSGRTLAQIMLLDSFEFKIIKTNYHESL